MADVSKRTHEVWRIHRSGSELPAHDGAAVAGRRIGNKYHRACAVWRNRILAQGSQADRKPRVWDVSEQEREETSPGAARSQHVVLMGPADARMMAAAMRPGIERSRTAGDTASPACLVITPTGEQAVTAAGEARRMLGPDGGRVVPVTGVVRARRVLATEAVACVVGTAEDLLQLRRDAALGLQHLQVVVIIGLDDILKSGDPFILAALLGDTSAEVMRVATFETGNAETEAFLEAQLRRARRLTPLVAGATPFAVSPRYALTTNSGRADMLRAILDEQDPPSLVVVAASAAGRADAREALERLGVTIDGVSVQVTQHPSTQHVGLTVLWEVPISHEAMVEALSVHPVATVALLLPEELPSFLLLTGGQTEVWTPPERKAAAGGRVHQLRAALRSTLTSGRATASELALLTPLLESNDAVEIAAAALRLYEAARREIAPARALPVAAARPALHFAPRSETTAAQAGRGSDRQQVFLAVGKRDGVRAGDIVGAIANEAGIPGDRIGKIDLRESHSIVELAAEDAARVVSVLASGTIRGRRLNARIDERGRERGGESESRHGYERRGERGGERSEHRGNIDRRGARGAGRGGGFGSGRTAGHDTGRGSSAGPRSPRASRDEHRAFRDRPIRERVEGRTEWAERSERIKHARRPARPRRSRPGESD